MTTQAAGAPAPRAAAPADGAAAERRRRAAAWRGLQLAVVASALLGVGIHFTPFPPLGRLHWPGRADSGITALIHPHDPLVVSHCER